MTAVNERLLQVGVIAADMWWIGHANTGMTNAQITRGVVTTAVMHLIEQGLLVVPDDIADRLDQPIRIQRDTSAEER